MDFEIVILGTDINAYYMARNTHEAYNKKAYLIGKSPLNFTCYSNIVNISYEPNLWIKEYFLNKLEEFALNHKDKKLVLIGSNDTYVRLIVENRKFLEKYYLFNYPSLEIVNNLLIKENFYQQYSEVLDLPKTYIYQCLNNNLDINKINTFMYPIIIKPSDGVLYYKNHFHNQAKVYKVNNEKEVKEVIKQIEESGYNGSLVIQEFIPGDDTCLFDSILYVGQDSKVKLQTYAQIGLQEHSKTGVGNCTLLANGYNEYNNTNEIKDKLVKFLEDINYTGIAEFDLKYDSRDKKFKIFEINPRQARSSYYLTAAGYNLVEYLVDELVFNKPKEFKFIDEFIGLTFVPMSVIKKHVLNTNYKKEIIKLKKQNKLVNPLKYKKDKSLKRKIWLFIRDINYNKKYKRNEW